MERPGGRGGSLTRPRLPSIYERAGLKPAPAADWPYSTQWKDAVGLHRLWLHRLVRSLGRTESTEEVCQVGSLGARNSCRTGTLLRRHVRDARPGRGHPRSGVMLAPSNVEGCRDVVGGLLNAGAKEVERGFEVCLPIGLEPALESGFGTDFRAVELRVEDLVDGDRLAFPFGANPIDLPQRIALGIQNPRQRRLADEQSKRRVASLTSDSSRLRASRSASVLPPKAATRWRRRGRRPQPPMC